MVCDVVVVGRCSLRLPFALLEVGSFFILPFMTHLENI